MVAYHFLPDSVMRLLTTQQADSGYSGVIAAPTDPVLYPSMAANLAYIKDTLHVDVALVMDANGNILVAPHAPELTGEHWDAALIVRNTLESGLRYMRT
jgi:hypothetical protein